MNERIKELLQESGIHYKIMPKETTHEKFAKLVIQECANLMYGRDENGNCKDGDVILKHFGIEK